MTMKIEGIFKIKSWDEDIIAELDQGGKLTRAHVTKSYTGGLQGEGVVEYLMAYNSDGSAHFVGYETVSGKLSEKSGSFVFEHRGTFKKGTVDSTWSVLEDSATGELVGLTGSVNFSAKHQAEYPIALYYEFH